MMPKLKSAIATMIMVSVAAAGCAVTTNQSTPRSAIPDDIVWQLYSVISSGEETEIVHKKPQLQIISEEQIFIGNDGCNSICGSVEYSTEDGSFKTDNVSQTIVACNFHVLDENGVVIETIETHNRGIVEMISAAKSYELNDNELRLQSGNLHILVFHPTSEPLLYKGSCGF